MKNESNSAKHFKKKLVIYVTNYKTFGIANIIQNILKAH